MSSIFDYVKSRGSSTQNPIEEREIDSQEVSSTASSPSSIFEIAAQAPRMEEKKSFLQELPRHAARSVSRGLETVAGLPKDLLNAQKNLILQGAEKLAGRELPALRTAIEAGQRMLPAYYMSGSQELKEGAKALSKDFLSPQNEAEELADNVVSDAVALMVPFTTKVPFWKTFLRAGSISGVGNLVGNEVEKQTGSSEKGEYAKLGTMFLSSLMSPKGLQSAHRYVGNLYEEAANAIRPSDTISANKMVSKLSSLRRQILAQRPQQALAPSEKFVVDEIDNVLGSVQRGDIPVEAAWSAKRSLNEKLDKLIFESPDRKLKARARKLATSINKELNDVLDDYGKANPAFGIPFNEAEEAFATLAKSRQLSDFVRKNARFLGSHATGTLLLEILTGHPMLALQTAGAAVGGAAINRAVEVAREVAGSPTLRRHYLNAIKAAAQENAVAMNKSLSALQEELEKKGILKSD
jgi:hypothetical protein